MKGRTSPIFNWKLHLDGDVAVVAVLAGLAETTVAATTATTAAAPTAATFHHRLTGSFLSDPDDAPAPPARDLATLTEVSHTCKC